MLSSLYCAPGGIPAFNRLLLRAASEHAAARGRQVRAVVLSDALGTQPERDEQLAASVLKAGWYLPCGGRRMRCAAEVLRTLRQEETVCIGHVNLAPLGLLGRRYGVVAHGTEVWTPLSPLRRLALRRAAAVGCVSDDTARAVRQVQGVDAGRCERLINALATLPAEPGDSAEDGRPLQVLSITRLHPGEPKGIDLMLRALVELPQVQYSVIGTGAALPELRALAERLGVAPRVRFLGGVSDAERDAALRACDVFALPSRGEGFGIVYLEAMANGKPCVGARAGGVPEVIEDRRTGLLVSPDVPSVRAAIAALAADPARRRQLGRAGRQRVEAHFLYPHFRRCASDFFARLEVR